MFGARLTFRSPAAYGAVNGALPPPAAPTLSFPRCTHSPSVLRSPPRIASSAAWLTVTRSHPSDQATRSTALRLPTTHGAHTTARPSGGPHSHRPAPTTDAPHAPLPSAAHASGPRPRDSSDRPRADFPAAHLPNAHTSDGGHAVGHHAYRVPYTVRIASPLELTCPHESVATRD